MARREPSKEATLREVLAEVSLVDIGRMAKGGLAFLGCWALFFVVIILISTATESAGFGLSNLGVPSWVFWLLFAWVFVHATSSERSFHEMKLEWYFPRTNWFVSLVLAAYLLGFVYLAKAVADMEIGIERGIAAFLVWFIYTAPFWSFIVIVSAGHAKLMEKRNAADSEERSERFSYE